MKERHLIKALFEKLVAAPIKKFSIVRGLPDAPKSHGVYVIYSPRGKVLYVGRTVRESSIGGSLQRRLSTHRFRVPGRVFRCMVVKNDRHRALLEAYTAGSLCPEHFPTGKYATYSM